MRIETIEEPEQIESEMAQQLLRCLSDESLSRKQRAKIFVAALARRLGRKVSRYAYELAMRWLWVNRRRLIGQITLSVVVALAMQTVAPLSGYGTIATNPETIQQGFMALAGSSMLSAFGSSSVAVAKMVLLDELRTRSVMGPFLRYNLIQMPAIQRLLEAVHVPEPYRTFTIEQLLTCLELNTMLAWNSNLFRSVEIGPFPVPLPASPNPDEWKNFASAKATQYFAYYGIPAIWTLARLSKRATTGSYKATKRMVQLMIDELSQIATRAAVRIPTSPVLLRAGANSRFEREMFRRIASLPSRDDVMRAAEEDSSELSGVAAGVFNDVTDDLVEQFDRAMVLQSENEPLDEESVAFMTPSELFVPAAVQRERELNLGLLAFRTHTRTAFAVAGGLLVTALVARTEAPEVAADALASVMPALGEHLMRIAQSVSGNAREYIQVDTLIFQLLANRIGLTRVIENMMGRIPIERVKQLRAIKETIESFERGLIQGESKHQLVKQFISLLIGRRIYSRHEIEKLKGPALLDALREAGVAHELGRAVPPDNHLRKLLFEMQGHNLDALNKMLFHGVAAQLAGTAGTTLAVRGSIALWDHARDLALAVTRSADLSHEAGLTELERQAADGILSLPTQHDVLGLGNLGALRPEAEQYARSFGPGTTAAVVGIRKVELFLGISRSAVAGPITHDIPANRIEYRDQFARQEGYPDWPAMKDAMAARRPTPAPIFEQRPGGTDEIEAMLRARHAHAIAEQRMHDLPQLETDLEEALRNDPFIVEYGLLEFLELFKKMLSPQQQQDAPPLQTNFLQQTPDDVPSFPLTDRMLDEELRKGLNLSMLPLAFQGVRTALEHGEGTLRSFGRDYDGEIAAAYNSLADNANMSLDAHSILRALLRSSIAVQPSGLTKTLLGMVAVRLPDTSPAAVERYRRIENLTAMIMKDPKFQQWVESQRVNVAVVVAKAAFKHLVMGRSQSEMYGEIAGVLVGGRSMDAAGAAVGRTVAQIPAAASAVAQIPAWVDQKLEEAELWTDSMIEFQNELTLRIANANADASVEFLERNPPAPLNPVLSMPSLLGTK